VREKAEKDERKSLAERRKKLKTRAVLSSEAQAVFNKFIRLRDDSQPCISCNRYHKGQYHAGHYISRGAQAHLSFNEDNCHKQCAPCNRHLSGNIARYRKRLIKKIGLERVEALENSNDIKKFSREELISIRAEYMKKVKQIIFEINNK
jgi:hypothetical protein